MEGSGQFADGRGSSREPAEDRPARRVGESGKRNAQTIHNRMVVHLLRQSQQDFFARGNFPLETCSGRVPELSGHKSRHAAVRLLIFESRQGLQYFRRVWPVYDGVIFADFAVSEDEHPLRELRDV